MRHGGPLSTAHDSKTIVNGALTALMISIDNKEARGRQRHRAQRTKTIVDSTQRTIADNKQKEQQTKWHSFGSLETVFMRACSEEENDELGSNHSKPAS
jgi:hypothetical protein